MRSVVSELRSFYLCLSRSFCPPHTLSLLGETYFLSTFVRGENIRVD